jgi:hypothetical protein
MIILITIAVGFSAMFNGQEFGEVLLVVAAIRSPLVDLPAAQPSIFCGRGSALRSRGARTSIRARKSDRI